MHARAHGGFDRLQIRAPVFMALSKDPAEELVYFPPHLLMDSSSRFFSASVQPPRACSTGRRAQMLSLRVTSSALSFWKRRNSATSFCALRKAAGLGKLSVTVLPATRRVRRNWGSWPGSFGFAQWFLRLPQRRTTAVIEPGRRSPRPRNSSRSRDRSASKAERESGIGTSYLSIYIRSEIYHKKRKFTAPNFQVAHPHDSIHFPTLLKYFLMNITTPWPTGKS